MRAEESRRAAGRHSNKRFSRDTIEDGSMEDASRLDNGAEWVQDARKLGNIQIVMVTYAVVVIFLCMAGYLVYFTVHDSSEVINNPYNKRRNILAERIVRGSIYSADGKTIAKTETDSEGNEKRVYPYNDIFCHVAGRVSNSMTGVELSQCYPLLTSHSNPFKQLANTFRGEKNKGDNVYTTLDAGLQQAAYNALGSYRGAAVAIEPSTGKILAMVSKPGYNPNTVEEDWESLIEDKEEKSALVNRATQGLYPPGSTFKLLTAIEYILENPSSYKKYTYQCEGSGSFEGNIINCYGNEKHGETDLEHSVAKSCNSSFANIGMSLNINSFKKLCNKFMFNQKLPVKFEYNKSKFLLDKKSDAAEIVQTAIGQGKTTITPLQNAVIAATIANKGEMMIPYVIDHTENDTGQIVKTYEPVSNGEVISEEIADIIGKYMMSVTEYGTASSLNSLSYQAAGKTGSAEFNLEGASHAWFIGYAPAKNPEIAVSIIVEGAGTGSQYAVPVARKMFEEFLGD